MTAPVLPGFRAPPLTPLRHPLLSERGIDVRVLRLDQVHPRIEGNKWFKLKGNLESVLASGRPVLSFGGAFSNHIRCLAAAGELFGFDTIGLIRGEIRQPLNPVLRRARASGMTLIPVSRSEYRRRHDPHWWAELRSEFGALTILPEGAGNLPAVRGCQEISRYLDWQAGPPQRIVLLPCATGVTLAGMLSGLSAVQGLELWGVAVLKAPGYLAAEVQGWLAQLGRTNSVPDWRIVEDFHCGGYARQNPALKQFLNDFAPATGLPLEPVYSGKLFFALRELIQQGAIARGSEVIAVHTGGVLPLPEIAVDQRGQSTLIR